MQWLYETKKRYSLVVLDYIITSNHTHLLVYDNGNVDVIPRSVQLLAGKIGELAGFDEFAAFQTAQWNWIDSALKAYIIKRKERWTESLAVGNHKFIDDILSQLGLRAKGRKIIEKGQTL